MHSKRHLKLVELFFCRCQVKGSKGIRLFQFFPAFVFLGLICIRKRIVETLNISALRYFRGTIGTRFSFDFLVKYVDFLATRLGESRTCTSRDGVISGTSNMAMGYTNRNFMEQPPRIQPPFTAPAASNILGSCTLCSHFYGESIKFIFRAFWGHLLIKLLFFSQRK